MYFALFKSMGIIEKNKKINRLQTRVAELSKVLQTIKPVMDITTR